MASRTTLRDLKAALEEVLGERDELAGKLAQLDLLVANLEGSIAFFAARTEEQESQPPAKTLRNAMVDILKDEGRPLHYGELLRQLGDRGVAVNGKDPLRLVGAHLSNDNRFKGVGSGIWGLSSWPESIFRLADRDWRDESPPSPTRGSVMPISLRDRIRESQTVPSSQAGTSPSDEDNVPEYQIPYEDDLLATASGEVVSMHEDERDAMWERDAAWERDARLEGVELDF